MLVICLSITATLIERWYVASREDLFVCAFVCVLAVAIFHATFISTERAQTSGPC